MLSSDQITDTAAYGDLTPPASPFSDAHTQLAAVAYRPLPHASSSRRKYPNLAGVIACLGNEDSIARRLA